MYVYMYNTYIHVYIYMYPCSSARRRPPEKGAERQPRVSSALSSMSLR